MLRNLLLTVIIVLFIPFVGLLIEKITHTTVLLFCKSNHRFALLYNYFTFPGVMHHELSHALFALLTGARITATSLFKPDLDNGTLGSVSFYTRGPSILQALQAYCAGVAPVPCGLLTCSLLHKYVIETTSLTIAQRGILLYLAFCILLHSRLSVADITTAARGIPLIAVVVFSTITLYSLYI